MKLKKASIFIMMMLIVVIVLMSCSASSKINDNPTLPNLPVSNIKPDKSAEDLSKRSVLAVYNAFIDPIARTFTISPIQRNADFHFPLSQYFPNVLQITDYGFSPNFWADIKLTHPFPGSGIDAFDPRVIAILPANPGVSFFYPSFGVKGNNRVVEKPDGYTKLFDSLGGSIVGNINPFMAYFKEQPYRRWSSVGATQETKRWQMSLAGFGGAMQFKLVVDVSTNYPNPPNPIIDNTVEPIYIYATMYGPTLSPDGEPAPIFVKIIDWQGHENTAVLIEAPDLFNSRISIPYRSTTDNPNEYLYVGYISNIKHAPDGDYKALIVAGDIVSGLYICKEATVKVKTPSNQGNLIWAKSAGGLRPDTGYAIAPLLGGRIVVTGKFSGTATFGKGESNQTILTSYSGSDTDVFIACYNSDGTLGWAKKKPAALQTMQGWQSQICG